MNKESVVIDRLSSIATERFPAWDTADLASPDFSEATRYTGWGYYIDEDLQTIWSELPIEARLVACIGAFQRQESDNAMCP